MVDRDDFRCEVVGESKFQEELDEIAGPKTRDGVELVCTANLVAEPDNPHDRNAVAVYIDRMRVGYLPRDKAAQVSPGLQRIQAMGQFGECEALIIGGWKNARGEGHYGVRLDLA